MDFNQVSLNKILLNLTAPQEKGISFNKGEILKGLVQDSRSNGLVTLMIKGQLIEAFTEVMVKPGQQLFLMVDDQREGKTYLKVVTPQVMSEIETANLSAGLLEVGIPAKEENLLMARKLLQHNLPVTQENINTLARGVKILGEPNSRNLEIVAWAQSQGININSKTLTAVDKFTAAQGSLTRALEALAQTLVKVENQPALNSVVLPSPASSSAQVVINSTEENQALNFGSLGSASSVLLNEETSPATNILPGKTLLPESSSTGAQAEPTHALNKVILLINTLLEMIILDMEQPDAQRANKIQAIVQNEPEVLENLSLLKDLFLKLANTDPQKGSFWAELIQRVDDVDSQLSGQRLFNSTAHLSANNDTYNYYFSLPVKVDNEYHLCQLKINRDNSRKRLTHTDHLNFVVSLETPRMGLVLFHVNWRKSDLQIQGIVENSSVVSYLSNNIDQLTMSLEGLGYRVTNLGIKTARDRSEFDLKPQVIETTGTIIRPFSIDVKI